MKWIQSLLSDRGNYFPIFTLSEIINNCASTFSPHTSTKKWSKVSYPLFGSSTLGTVRGTPVHQSDTGPTWLPFPRINGPIQIYRDRVNWAHVSRKIHTGKRKCNRSRISRCLLNNIHSVPRNIILAQNKL